MQADRSRLAPRARPGRRLTQRIGLGLVVTVTLAALVAGDASAAKSRAKKPKAQLTVTVGEKSAASAGPDTSISDEQAQRVLDTVRQYVQIATVDPIRKGAPAADLSGVFGAAVAPLVSGADRPILVDEGLPKAKGKVVAAAAPLTLVGLGDHSGAVILITATLDLNVTAKVAKRGPKLQIHRAGSLILEPDASTWKITGYDVAVTRAGGGVDPPTSSTTSTTVKTR